MGTDVRASVKTNASYWEILRSIQDSLRKYTYIDVNCELNPQNETAKFNFKVVDQTAGEKFYFKMPIVERRSLFIIFRDGKVTIDLSNWGMAEEIIHHVAVGLMEFGDVYYTPDDCLVEPYKLKVFEVN